MDQRRNNKGYCLVTGAALGCPNMRLYKGHFSISAQREGVLEIVHHGFLEELLDTEAAFEAAHIAAQAWVNTH